MSPGHETYKGTFGIFFSPVTQMIANVALFL